MAAIAAMPSVERIAWVIVLALICPPVSAVDQVDLEEAFAD